MISVAVVVSRQEMREGISQLLEADGDIDVVAQFSSLREYEDCPPTSKTVLVIGPAVAEAALQGHETSLDPRRLTVALVAFPGSSGYHDGVLEAPLELSGHHLRNSVRLAALVLSEPSTT